MRYEINLTSNLTWIDGGVFINMGSFARKAQLGWKVGEGMSCKSEMHIRHQVELLHE